MTAEQRLQSPLREKLMGAASELFCSEGINVVGVDRIALKAGVAKMSLYHYFQSKDQLVLAYLEQVGRKQVDSLDKATAGKKGKQAILAVFDAAEADFGQPGFRGCPLSTASTELGPKAADAQSIILQQKESVRTRIEGWATEAGVEDARDFAYQVMLMREGALLLAWLESHHEPIRRARQQVGKLLGK
jgi:AcrR family transcriptional regulator